MQASGFIDDQPRKGYVEAWPGLYPALRFEYRAMLSDEIDEHADATEGRTAVQYAKTTRELLAKKLVKWNLATRDGKPVEITVDNLRRVQPKLAQRVMGIVFGNRASDVDPDWTDEEKREYAGDESVATREAADEGNSDSG